MQTAVQTAIPLPPIEVRERDDGSILISSTLALPAVPPSIGHVLDEAAARWPTRACIAKRPPDGGEWHYLCYAQAKHDTDAIAQALLDRGLGQHTAVLILSENSIAHFVMTLGAMKAGVPPAPVSVGYSLAGGGDFSKLKHVVELLEPKMIFAEDGRAFAPALRALSLAGVEVVTCTPVPGLRTTPYAELLATPVTAAVARNMATLGPETIGKILFTSGSTGLPKGVYQTQRMMCVQLAQQDVAPVLVPVPADEVPTRLEWQPWSHLSAGTVGMNRALRTGATTYIDEGRPVPGRFAATIRNLKELRPRIYSSAPVAFALLVDALEEDAELRERFFSRLLLFSYGGAALSNDICKRLQALAIATTGHTIPINTMYGSTEAQGITTMVGMTERVGLIGFPLPGMTLKLAPCGNKYELRVKGPTITPGYVKRPDLTAAAFDEEGFYKLGDAAKWADPNDPYQGLLFDGRVTEDFKLSSGTWVSVGPLRTDLIAAAQPLIHDAVICGHDQRYLAVLAWPSLQAAKALCSDPTATTLADILSNEAVIAHVRAALAHYNKQAGGSSRRIERLIFLLEPPVPGVEIVEKGYINQRATLERRADLVAKLYMPTPGPEVIVIEA
jgi:feruloyl-CoA synthase